MTTEQEGNAMILIVPNSLRDKINEKLDLAFASMTPEESEEAQTDREYLYKQLLFFFGENGHLPDFTVQKKG